MLTEGQVDTIIMNRLREAPSAQRLRTIATVAGLDITRTRASLVRLMTSGRVEYNGRGAYRLAVTSRG